MLLLVLTSTRPVLIVCTLCGLVTTLARCDTVRGEYLTSSVRLHDPAYADSLYMCHACGGGIQLLVNSASVGFHLPTDEVGSNSYRTEPGDSTRLNYLSMVVSKQTTNGSTCLDVLLIVTQAKSEYDEGSPLNIVCRSSTQEFQIPYQRSQRRITAIANNTVFLSHIIGTNLVTGNENLVTNIFLCSTNESSMSWRRNRQPVGAFNGLHTAGDDEQVLHKNDSSVLFLETILLAKRAGDITSLLLLTDFNSSMNSTISCTSNLNFIVISQNDSYVSNEDASQVTTMVQDIQETTTNMIITNTDKENTDEGNMDNGNTSTEKNAGLESWGVVLVSMAVLLLVTVMTIVTTSIICIAVLSKRMKSTKVCCYTKLESNTNACSEDQGAARANKHVEYHFTVAEMNANNAMC